jgi:valyl-tRNA synthetase
VATLVSAEMADGADQLIALVREIRTARAEAGTDPAAWLPATLWLGDGSARAAYHELGPGIARLARIQPTLAASVEEFTASSAEGALSALAGPLEARLQRPGADLERERQRLSKDLAQAQSSLEQTEARLADDRFTGRAPAAVVEQTRVRAAELRDQVARLSDRLNG